MTKVSIIFPTVILPVHSYIGDMMDKEAPDSIEEFMLLPFSMKVQGIDRTLADKVFAICDYYLQVCDVASPAYLPHSGKSRLGCEAGAVMKFVFIPFVYCWRAGTC